MSFHMLLLNPILLHPLLNNIWRYQKSLRYMLRDQFPHEVLFLHKAHLNTQFVGETIRN